MQRVAARNLAGSIAVTSRTPAAASRQDSRILCCRRQQACGAAQTPMAAVRRPAAAASAPALPRRRGCRGASRLQAAAAATMELTTRPAVEGSFMAAASLVADASAEPPQRPRSAEEALAASLSRSTLHWTALAALASSRGSSRSAASDAGAGAASGSSEDAAARLQQQRQLLEGSAALEPYRFALEEGASDAGAECGGSSSSSSIDRVVEETLEEWQAVAHQRPKGFDREALLAQAGVAEAAVVTRGGRVHGYWKGVNQDAFSLTQTSSSSMLLCLCDGHGRRGEAASQAAAERVAAALPACLEKAAGAGSSLSSCSSADEPTPASQQALVAAFQEAARSINADPAYTECGSAVAACLLEPGSLTVAWVGDCRAVVGLSIPTAEGPRCLVHALTQDHKPSSPLERARIAATSRGRVIQTQPGRPHRLTGFATNNSLSLSRGFGDTWASLLGMTAEPDAVTLVLPPSPTNGGCDCTFADDGAAASAVAAGSTCALDSVSSSSDSDDASSSSSSTAAPTAELPTPAVAAGAAAAPAGRHVVILACDGLWDMLPNEEAVSIALRCESAEAAAHAVVQAARRKWAAAYRGLHMDDITAAVAFLPC